MEYPALRTLHSSIVAACALALVQGCQTPLPIGPLPSFTIQAADAATIVEALATKGNHGWQDAGLTHAPLLARRQAQGYRTLSTPVAGPAWSRALPAVSTSAPVFRRANMRSLGPTPIAGDCLYVATESGAGTPQIFRVDARDGAVMNGAGWDALAGLASPGTIQRSAVLMSGDNRRLYLLTSGGYFISLDAENGSRLYAGKLSTSGFGGLAPFIDYSNGGGYPALGSDENVYAVAADGSMYRVKVKDGVHTATAWPAASGPDAAAWGASAKISYGQATSVRAFPIVWNSQAYFGTLDGRVVRVDLRGATPVVTTWRPAAGTSALSRGVTAPVAVAFDAAFTVSDVFVPCGDRLAWIDVKAPIVEEAVRVSPPLAVTKTTPVQGALATYPYAAPVTKGPYDCIDFVSIAAKSAPAPSRWGNGTGRDGRVFGADGYNTPTDGNDVRGYLQFEIPVGAYGGAIPVGGRIDLSAGNLAASAETVKLYRASNFIAGTNSYWSGMNYAPDIDWFNRPILGSDQIGGFTGMVSPSDATTGLPRYGLPFNNLEPVDQPTIDAYAWHTFAMASAGKQRSGPPSAPESSEAARWFRGVVGVNNAEPKLFVTLDNAALTPTETGLQCQAAVDEWTKRVWVQGSNALFELNYTSPQTFTTREGVSFSLTAAGRALEGAGGPTTAGTPKRYVFPRGNVLFTGTRAVVVDSDPATNRFFLNDFKVPLASSADALEYHYAAPAGSGQIGEQMLFDYHAGSAYMTGRDNTLRRVDIR